MFFEGIWWRLFLKLHRSYSWSIQFNLTGLKPMVWVGGWMLSCLPNGIGFWLLNLFEVLIYNDINDIQGHTMTYNGVIEMLLNGFHACQQAPIPEAIFDFKTAFGVFIWGENSFGEDMIWFRLTSQDFRLKAESFLNGEVQVSSQNQSFDHRFQKHWTKKIGRSTL